jgi:hypothetical protein
MADETREEFSPKETHGKALGYNQRITLAEALAKLPGSKGERFATVLEYGGLLVEILRSAQARPADAALARRSLRSDARQRRIPQRHGASSHRRWRFPVYPCRCQGIASRISRMTLCSGLSSAARKAEKRSRLSTKSERFKIKHKRTISSACFHTESRSATRMIDGACWPIDV